MAIEDGDTEVLVPMKRRAGDQPRSVWDVLKQYGLAGVVILGLGYFAWSVYENMQAQQNEVFKTQQETIKAQAKAAQDMTKEMITVVENNTKAISGFEKRVTVIEEWMKRIVRGGPRAEIVEPYP
jgi:hypothetical protein